MNPTEPSEELFVLTLDVIEDDEQLEAWADDFIRRDALAQRRASENRSLDELAPGRRGCGHLEARGGD